MTVNQPQHNPTMNERALERLAQRIVPQGRLTNYWRLSGGISAGMTALEIANLDGTAQRYVLRMPGKAALQQNPLAAAIEFSILQGLHSQGISVPGALLLAQAGDLFGSPCFVIEFVEGRVDFSPANLRDAMQQYAAQLARIHRVDCAREGFPPLASYDNGADLANALEGDLDTGRVRQALAGTAGYCGMNPPVLLHGDYWSGNVLWLNGKLAAVIDWEDACLGDPLIDLAICRLDTAWIFGFEAMDALTTAYFSMSTTDPHDLPYWDLMAALRLARLVGEDLEGWAAFFLPYD